MLKYLEYALCNCVSEEYVYSITITLVLVLVAISITLLKLLW